MAVVLIANVPSRELYESVSAAAHVNDDPPPGVIVHTATEMPDGTVKIIDVWESQADFEAFERDRLMPAFQSLGGPAEPPPREVYEPFDVMR
jgi:hypothetical protein